MRPIQWYKCYFAYNNNNNKYLKRTSEHKLINVLRLNHKKMDQSHLGDVGGLLECRTNISTALGRLTFFMLFKSWTKAVEMLVRHSNNPKVSPKQLWSNFL